MIGGGAEEAGRTGAGARAVAGEGPATGKAEATGAAGAAGIAGTTDGGKPKASLTWDRKSGS